LATSWFGGNLTSIDVWLNLAFPKVGKNRRRLQFPEVAKFLFPPPPFHFSKIKKVDPDKIET